MDGEFWHDLLHSDDAAEIVGEYLCASALDLMHTWVGFELGVVDGNVRFGSEKERLERLHGLPRMLEVKHPCVLVQINKDIHIVKRTDTTPGFHGEYTTLQLLRLEGMEPLTHGLVLADFTIDERGNSWGVERFTIKEMLRSAPGLGAFDRFDEAHRSQLPVVKMVCDETIMALEFHLWSQTAGLTPC